VEKCAEGVVPIRGKPSQGSAAVKGVLDAKTCLVSRRKQSLIQVWKSDVAQFINKLMQRGKKSTAQRIFLGSFTVSRSALRKECIDTFELATQERYACGGG